MRSNIKLYIAGNIVDIDNDTSILISKKFENYTNPTATQNDYSKTVSLPGTPNNNMVFEQIFRLDQQVNEFNPSKRVDFVLTLDNTVIESGYMKLNNITKTEISHTYNITLYGGLGSFFYELSEKDLSNVIYPASFTHTINKETIYNSFRSVIANESQILNNAGFLNGFSGWDSFNNTVYSIIENNNAVSGYSMSFSTNPNDNTGINQLNILTPGNTYSFSGVLWSSVNGTVVRMGSSNNAARITLTTTPTRYTLTFNPTVTSVGVYQLNVDTSVTATIYFYDFIAVQGNQIPSYWGIKPSDNLFPQSPYMLYLPTYNGFYPNFESNKVWLGTYNGDDSDYTILPKNFDEWQRNELRSYYQRPALRLAELIKRICDQSNYTVQFDDYFFNPSNPYWNDLYLICPQLNTASNSSGDSHFSTANMNAVVSSIALNTTVTSNITLNSVNNDPSYPSTITTGGYINLTSYPEGSIKIETAGYFRIIMGLQSVATSPVQQVFRLADGASMGVYINIGSSRIFTYVVTYSAMFRSLPSDTTGRLFYLDIPISNTDMMIFDNTFQGQLTSNIRFNGVLTAKGNFDGDVPVQYYQLITKIDGQDNPINISYGETKRSNSTVNYTDVVRPGTTQLELLMSYLKPFGFLFEKDKVDNIIRIKSRKSHFANYEIVDWTDKLDRSKKITIDPVPFRYRYGLFKWKNSNSYYSEYYRNKYNREYAQTRINTGWEFDNKEETYINTIIENSIQSLEYDSNYTTSDKANRAGELIALFNKSNRDRETSDTKYTLAFCNKTKTLPSNIYITDDDITLASQNIYTYRYQGDESLPTNIINNVNRRSDEYSLDFSVPEEEFISAISYDENSTIYNRFWDKFMNERLNIDNKILTAYFNLTIEEVANWDFTKFVTIDNTLYFVNSIIDFNMTDYATTKCELIRVSDINGYIDSVKLEKTYS